MSIFSAFTKKGKAARSPVRPSTTTWFQRDFSASRNDELWFTDITEHATTSRRRALHGLDEDALLGSHRRYSIPPRMTRHSACAALRNAIALRDHQGTIFTSEPRSQFRSRLRLDVEDNGLVWLDGTSRWPRVTTRRHGIVPLVVARNNVLDTKKWETREELRVAIVT